MFKKLFPSPFSPELMTDFLDSGMSEDKSPLLSRSGRSLSKNLPLKTSLLSLSTYLTALFLYVSRGFFPESATHLLHLSHLFTLITFFLAGTPAIVKSFEDLAEREFNIDVLMTVAAFGSIFIGSSLEGALLLVLFSISEALGESVSEKAKSTLSSLKQLSPQTAWIFNDEGILKRKTIKSIQVGDIIHVKSGEIVPLDGVIVRGSSSINLTHLTGEKVPIFCKEGSSVPSGARNLEGSFDLRVLKTGADSTLEHIIQLVVRAQKTKPQLQQRLDKYSSVYALSIFTISLGIALLVPLLTSMPFINVEDLNNCSIYRALAFLIAASPCALIIAVPIAYLSAVNSCARQGILLKGGVTLDRLLACSMVAMDKTGTLTTGQLTCLGWDFFGEDSFKTKFLSIVRGVEQSTTHPIAQAIESFIEKQNIPPTILEKYVTKPGEGVQACVNGEKVFVGRIETAIKNVAPENLAQIETLVSDAKKRGEICSLATVGVFSAIFYCKDVLRPDAQEAVKGLADNGLKVVMLTGDHAISAKNTANLLGIDQIYASLTPEAKLKKIETLAKSNRMMMIGDGINDAPALAKSFVGIAMGEAGNAAAIDAADIVLLNNTLSSLPKLLRKAKKTRFIVSQNITLALSIIFFVSIPASLGIIPLWLAVILHEGSTVIVGLNALRLLKN
ncbi:cation-translocating P-type ATPase [Chlamydiifrater phoenicopteri]|uniref:cation-translocating P-type ATPase n=1 Tax=Chlamydiifrater phoenicopteri TaxID=2681469 RepID=UPI001BCABAAD|nr:cation-translocating P-type ATPase [Chlamydiifrater phoenicopteri]